MKLMPQDVLKNMKLWGIDSKTPEMVMEYEDEQELLRVYDPIHLVNLSKPYFQVLNDIKIFYSCVEDRGEEIQESCLSFCETWSACWKFCLKIAFDCKRKKKNKKQMKLLPKWSLLVHFGLLVLHSFIISLVCNKL